MRVAATSMVACVDLDDVLNCLVGHIGVRLGITSDDHDLEWYQSKHGWNLIESINHYRPDRLKVSEHDFWKALDENFWAEVPKSPVCNELLSKLADMFGSSNVHIVTAYSMYPSSLSGKMRWIHRNLPPWIHNNVHMCRNKSMLARPNRLLIDDAMHNIVPWSEVGNVFRVPKPWNCNSFKNGDDWEALHNFIEDIDQ